MNQLIQNQQALLQETLALREQVLASISDADLAFSLPGNPSLGELITEFGTVEAAYTRSFWDFSLRFDLAAPGGLQTVEALRAWFKELDAGLMEALSALGDQDLARPVDRGGWSLPVEANFHVFREGVLIFAAKAVVYLRALGKPLPGQLADWIG